MRTAFFRTTLHFILPYPKTAEVVSHPTHAEAAPFLVVGEHPHVWMREWLLCKYKLLVFVEHSPFKMTSKSRSSPTMKTWVKWELFERAVSGIKVSGSSFASFVSSPSLSNSDISIWMKRRLLFSVDRSFYCGVFIKVLASKTVYLQIMKPRTFSTNCTPQCCILKTSNKYYGYLAPKITRDSSMMCVLSLLKWLLLTGRFHSFS